MAKKEEKVLEREYIIPLRKAWLKVPKYRRAKRAIKEIKSFIARHMKVEGRDERKVKLDKYLNEEIWFRGIKKPQAKIEVRVIKNSEGNVKVELAEIPEAIKYKVEKEKRKSEEEKRKAEEKKKKAAEEAKKKEEAEESEEEKEEKEEKKEAVIEAGLKEAEKAAKETKHMVVGQKIKRQPLARKALKK